MSGPAGIRLRSVLSGRTEIFLSGAPLMMTKSYEISPIKKPAGKSKTALRREIIESK